MRRYAFVMDPMETCVLDRDSSYAMMEEAQRRDAEIWHLEPGDLFVDAGRLLGRARQIRVGPRPHRYDVLDGPLDLDLGGMSAVFLRKDPPYDMAYILTTMLLDLLDGRVPVVNRPSGVRNCNEKLVTARFPDLVPETLISRDATRLKEFRANAGGAVVVKPWDGNGGRGVFVIHPGDRNAGVILETLTDEGRRFILMQHYLPAIAEGDKRIILIDGEPRGAFLRVPSAEDHRGNMHVGAVVRPCGLTDSDRTVCARLAPFLRQEGLLFTGIDVIGDKLTEVNVTSPTGLQEIHRFTGTRVEVDLFDRVEALLP